MARHVMKENKRPALYWIFFLLGNTMRVVSDGNQCANGTSAPIPYLTSKQSAGSVTDYHTFMSIVMPLCFEHACD